MKERIAYVDAAKASAIILMVIGHCYWKHGIPYVDSWIYSFHMPLFFIISGMFIKDLSLSQGLHKYSKAYLKPYFITCLLIAGINLSGTALCHSETTEEALKTEIIKIFFASGYAQGEELFATTPAIGCLWFLFAMFWACTIYSFLKKHFDVIQRMVWVFVIFALAYFSIQKIRLPFSFQAGCSAVFYLWVGDMVKSYSFMEKMERFKKVTISAATLIWITSVVFAGGVSISVLDFGNLYGLSIIKLPVSVIASCLVIYAVKAIHLSGGWIGTSTLYILCGHKLVTTTMGATHVNWNLLSFASPANFMIEAIIQILCALLLGLVLKKIKLF